MRLVLSLLLLTLPAWTQKYTGPVPAKEDLPYIVQADNLIPTEAATAKEEKGKKDETVYIVEGAASTARTPLASPVFIIKAKDLTPAKLQLRPRRFCERLPVHPTERAIQKVPQRRF